MSLKTLTCVAVVCDDCGNYLQHEDCNCHYPSARYHLDGEVAAADALALEWWAVEGDRHLCRSCARPKCERLGHDWRPFQDRLACADCDAERPASQLDTPTSPAPAPGRDG